MDVSGGYHPEWGKPVTKEVTWYALTDKWILAQKLRILKYNLQNTRKSRRRKTNMWILHSSLEYGIKYPWKELQRQSLELRWRMDYAETTPPVDLSHNQPPNTDIIAYTSNILLKGPWYSCLLWGFASAWQIQKRMLTVIYWMEHRAPNGGARESTQELKGSVTL